MNWAAFGWWLDKWLMRLWLALMIGLVLFVLALGIFGAAKAAPENSAPSHMQAPAIGCTSKKLFDRIGDMLSSGDEAAAEKLERDGLAANVCVIFREGDAVFIDALHPLGESKIHRPGDPTEYWINTNAVMGD